MDTIYPFISVNLATKKKEELAFPFLDYGYLYGYGLFETIHVYQGQPLLLEAHLQRMEKAATILEIPFLHSIADVVTHTCAIIKENQVEEAILNLYLTPGNRDADPAKSTIEHPFFLQVLRVWPGYTNKDALRLDLRQESFKKTPLDQFKTLSWVKHTLENRLSKGFDDVLLYDDQFMLSETTRSNIFFVKKNHLVTPQSKVILKGVVRDFILENAVEFGYSCEERAVYLDEILGFDEVFVTNSLRGVANVTSLGEFDSISSGEAVWDLQQKYKDKVSNKL